MLLRERKSTDTTDSLKDFTGPANIPTIFQEKIDRTLGDQIPVWLDDIIIVTRRTKEEHTQKLESVLTKPGERRLQSQQKVRILPKRNGMAGTHHLT